MKKRDNGHGKYIPTDFILPPVDEKGHSIRMYVTLPPIYKRQVSVILNSGSFPFRAPEDILRWCVITGLKELDKLEPDEQSFLAQADAINRTVTDMLYEAEYGAVMAAIDKGAQVLRAHSNGDRRKLRKYLTEMREKIDGIAEGFWRVRAQEEFEKRFGDELAPKLKLKGGK